ncbi:hypothetical protein BH18ACT9_BH18ACT9_16650 [soil metagenome]
MRHLAALLLGAAVAIAAVLVHRHGFLAVALAVAASLATAERLHRCVVSSLASAFCLGWVVLLGVVLAGRPEGDWAVGSDFAGYAVMSTGLVMIVVGLVSLPARGSVGQT